MTRLYHDVPADILERDEGLTRPVQLQNSAWQTYLYRMLPPTPSTAPDTRQALHSPQGMADFLLSQGRTAARDLSGALAPHNRFWATVRREVEHLAPG